MFTQRSFLLNLSKEIDKENVSFAQFFLLGYLAKEDYLTTTDIAKKLGLSTAAATGFVARLEKFGFVQCLDASDDRRKAMVQITRKGIGLVDKMREDLVENYVEVMAEIDPVGRAENEGSAKNGDAPDEPAEISKSRDHELVAAVNRGLPQEFWREYRILRKRGEESVLDAEEIDRLIEMSGPIEEADAERLEAIAELADLRSVSFKDIVSEYDIGAPVGT